MKTSNVTIFTEPFPKAEIKILGKSPQEAQGNAYVLCRKLKSALSKDNMVWTPKPKGFDPVAKRHFYTMTVSLGGDVAEAEKIIRGLA